MPGTGSRSRIFLVCSAGRTQSIVFLAPQQMPDDHRQLASGRDGSDVLATTR